VQLVEHHVDVLRAHSDSLAVDVGVASAIRPEAGDCAQAGLVLRSQKRVRQRQPGLAVVHVLAHVNELAVDDLALEGVRSVDADLLVEVPRKDRYGDEDVGPRRSRHELAAIVVADALDVLLDGRLRAGVEVAPVVAHAPDGVVGVALDVEHCVGVAHILLFFYDYFVE